MAKNVENAKKEPVAEKKSAKGTTKKKFSLGKVFKSIGGFFRGIVGEIRKISWPTLKATLKDTVIVIVACLIIGAFIWAFDFGFDRLITWFMGLGA